MNTDVNTESYVFSETQLSHERQRLEVLQSVFDPQTHDYLDQIGVAAGSTCLEVGAGAGSIMHGLCDRVGPSGRVVAVDFDPRFIAGTNRSNLEIRPLDIGTAALETNCYDLIHVRAVLMHLQDANRALQTLVRSLKPGGWLLVEEPDFAHAIAVETDTAEGQCIDRIFAATRKLYEEMGVAPYLGRRLPLWLQQQQFHGIETRVNTAFFQGRSPRSKIWQMALEGIGTKLTDAELVSSTDIAQFIQLTHDPTIWMLDYAMVSAWGQKP